MLGFDPRVRRIQAQPFAVDLVAGKLLRTAEERKAARSMYGARKGASIYTPDFYVERADGKQLAVEVKLGGFVGGDADHERLHLATQVLANYGHEVVRVIASPATGLRSMTTSGNRQRSCSCKRSPNGHCAP